MGSPISLTMANLFIEKFETKTLSTAPNPPSLWLRYVDDTFVIMITSHKSKFPNHINAVEPNIKFTVEETRPDGAMPFFNTLMMPKQDSTLEIEVYKILTHTDLHL